MRAAWAPIVIAIASCADGSGVLIEIRRPVDDPATPVDEAREVLPTGDAADLRLYAGLASGIDPLTNGRAAWNLDDSSEDDDPALPGNGLVWKDPAEPFRALITPAGARGEAIYAIAHASSAMDAQGGLASPATLGDDLTRARLQLALAGPTLNANTRCVADTTNQIFFDANEVDCDGDRWNYPYDCDDMDPLTYPVFYESACCNRDNTPPIISTRSVAGEGCEMLLTCDGNDPSATGARWTTTDSNLCNCAAQPDLIGCASAADYVCTVRHEANGEPCPPALSNLETSMTSCSWQIVGRVNPLKLEFTTGGMVSTSCGPEVTVKRIPVDAPAILSWAVLDLNGEAVLVQINPLLDVGCTITPALDCRPH